MGSGNSVLLEKLGSVVFVRTLLISFPVASAHRGSPEAEFMNVQYVNIIEISGHNLFFQT